MNRKQTLWEYLERNNVGWHTAAELSVVVGVSPRTIKTYIKDAPKRLKVESGRKGYRVRVIQVASPEIRLEDSQQRIRWIENQLLTQSSVNLYDMAAMLFTSESTILRDLKEIKQHVQKFSLTIESHHDDYAINGSEIQKRKMISSLLYDETRGGFVDRNLLATNFPDIDSHTIKAAIIQLAKLNQIYVNTFDINNILLHLVIAVQRIESGHHIHQNSKMRKKSSGSKAFIPELLDQVEAITKVTFPRADREELAIVINYSISRWHKDLIDNVSKEAIMLSDDLINYVWSMFSVNLDNTNFRSQFTIHLDRLLKRSRSNQVVHNPLASRIKRSSPTIYECAVLMAHRISQKAHIMLDDNEIAFVAMHIGNAIAEQIGSQNKLKVLILSPDYQEDMFGVIDKIKRKFQNSIVIIDVLNDPMEVKASREVDFVIEINVDYDVGSLSHVTISPFLLPNDISKLSIAIESCQHRRHKMIFQRTLMSYFTKENFAYTNQLTTRNEIFDFVTRQFVAQKIVDSGFYENLVKRETMSSTAFGRFAIPHSFTMNANKSRGFVIINPKGIQWQGQTKVYIVIVLAVDPNNKKLFREVFDELSEIIIDENNLTQILKCKSYEDFIVRLTDFM